MKEMRYSDNSKILFSLLVAVLVAIPILMVRIEWLAILPILVGFLMLYVTSWNEKGSVKA